jgi:DNA-binding response OmpR family regulator
MEPKILVVDDNTAWRATLADALAQARFDVISAASGAAALEALARGPIELVVLDVQLPGTDGYEICRRVRQQLKYIPIVMVSGVRRSLDDRAHGLDVGADRYFEKPVDTRELIAQVQALQLERIAYSH